MPGLACAVGCGLGLGGAPVPDAIVVKSVVIESCCLAMEARTQVILWEYLKTGSETDTALSPLRCHCINEKRCPGVTY